MRTWISLLVVLALIAAALIFGLGLLDDDGETDSGDPVAESDPAPEGNEPDETDPLLRPTGSEPEGMPPLEVLPIEKPLGILLLVGVPQRLGLFMASQWDSHPQVTVKSWAAPLPEGRHEGVPSGNVLPGLLPAPPRGALLDDENIDVVVVHDLDPAEIDRDFWLEVVNRVQDGRLGLLVVPGVVTGQKMLDHDALAQVLPIAKAAAIEGQPLPGNFKGLASFVPTNAGMRHPASRLVQWPDWSRRIWGAQALLETPWGTKVCYPVEEVAAGASVLVDAKPAEGEALPALIASAPENGHVLWFGGWDLGSRQAYGRPSIVTDWQTLLRNWAAWLAGRAAD